MTTFFVSYNRADRQWAEWIAWHLEEAGYKTVIQAWDIRPGSNFAVAMQDATAKSDRTIAVLSPDYVEAKFTQAEWSSTEIGDAKKLTTFKLFVIDEAWRFLSHAVIKSYIREALKTWRKKNAAMILATQSSDDLWSSDMLPVVVESCPTKLFLANPDMDGAAYREGFHLNETEAALIARLIPKQQFLLKRPDMAKVLNLHVAAKDHWLFTSNPQDRERRQEAFERYGMQKGLEILGRSTK